MRVLKRNAQMRTISIQKSSRNMPFLLWRQRLSFGRPYSSSLKSILWILPNQLTVLILRIQLAQSQLLCSRYFQWKHLFTMTLLKHQFRRMSQRLELWDHLLWSCSGHLQNPNALDPTNLKTKFTFIDQSRLIEKTFKYINN